MAWKKYKNGISNLSTIPLIIAVAITPLIVRLKPVVYPLVEVPWRNNQTTYADFFTYYKGQVVIFAAFLAILMGAYYYFKEQIEFKKTKYTILIGISVGFIILTTILSKYPHWAKHGQMNRAEGAYVLVSYFILALYGSLVIKNKKQLKTIIYAFFASALIMNIIGIFQFIGKDIFRTDFMKSIILPSQYQGQNITFKVAADRVYMTLFNPNYVGSYLSIVIVLSINMILNSKNIYQKAMWGVLLLLSVPNLIGSQSQAGIVGLVFGLIALLIINYKTFLDDKVISLVTLAVILVGAGMFITQYKDGRIINAFKREYDGLTTPREYKLDSIVTNDNNLSIKYNNTNFRIEFNGENIRTYDENDETLKIVPKNGQNTFDHPKLNDIVLQFVNYKNRDFEGLQLKMDNNNWNFALGDFGIRYVNSIGKLINMNEVQKIDIKGYETVGSGRGYIWSRSVPLLKPSILLGAGPDSFIFEFPQTDYVGKSRTNMLNTVVDKPHNMYLQYGINIGLIPLLFYLTLIVLILINTFKVSLLHDEYFVYSSSVFIIIIAFMFTGFFNDSTVIVSPIFYSIVGMGLGVI